MLQFHGLRHVSISAIQLDPPYTRWTFEEMVKFAMKHLPLNCCLHLDYAWVSGFTEEKYGRGNIKPDTFPQEHDCRVTFGHSCAIDRLKADGEVAPWIDRPIFKDTKDYQWELLDAHPLTPSYRPSVPLFQLDSYNPTVGDATLCDFDLGMSAMSSSEPSPVLKRKEMCQSPDE